MSPECIYSAVCVYLRQTTEPQTRIGRAKHHTVSPYRGSLERHGNGGYCSVNTNHHKSIMYSYAPLNRTRQVKAGWRREGERWHRKGAGPRPTNASTLLGAFSSLWSNYTQPVSSTGTLEYLQRRKNACVTHLQYGYRAFPGGKACSCMCVAPRVIVQTRPLFSCRVSIMLAKLDLRSLWAEHVELHSGTLPLWYYEKPLYSRFFLMCLMKQGETLFLPSNLFRIL